MNWVVIAGVVLIVLAIINLIRLELKKFKVTHYTIPMWSGNATFNKNDKLTKVCRFVFLSDLHNNSFGKDNCELLEAIDEAKPDFIVSAGDMLIGKPKASMEVAKKLMRELTKKYPVYYGNGNHEYRLKIYPETYGNMYQEYKSTLEECGVHLLENDHEVISFGKHKINICGLEIDRHYFKRFKKIYMDDEYIESEVGKKPNIFTILIAHNPMYFPQYANWGAELTLSGHLHGGVVRLPKLGGVISPQMRLFPHYDGGLYKNNGKMMVLSRGLGTHTIPIRIANRAELIVIDLADKVKK